MPHRRFPRESPGLLLCVALASPALAGERAAPVADPVMLAFSAKLGDCTAASAGQPHPLMHGFTIEHRVAGPRDGRCDYTQGMPGGMRMLCAFDDASRAAFAAELARTARTGAMSGGSARAQPAWARACEIETRDGKRLPMGGE